MRGLFGRRLNPAAFHARSRLFVVGGDYLLYTSADRGATWIPVQGPEPPSGDFLGIKSVTYWRGELRVGTTQGLWEFEVSD